MKATHVIRAVGQEDTRDVRRSTIAKLLAFLLTHVNCFSALVCSCSRLPVELLASVLYELALRVLRVVSWPGKQATLKQSIVLMLIA